MSDLPEPLNRARAAAHNAARTTGPQNAIRATSPASPYARDRIEAPSNRPAPRTPTLRSRTQDVLRSAPGALTAARERSVYDTTPQGLVRGAQELTGLPSLARGAGALAALPALARSGFLGTEHIAPGAMAVGETALGLLGPMSLPRGAGRVAAPAADISRPISAGTLDGRTFYRGQGGDIQGGGSFRRNSHISANPETANNYATMNLSGAERAPTVFPLRGTGRIADRDGVMSVVDELVAGGMSREEALRQAIPELERRGFAGFQMARRGDPEFDDDIQIFNPSANLRSAFDAEPAQRIPNMAREIGPNGMPVAQSQPTRNSFRGGSSDLREAAGMRADLEAPPQVFEAFHNSPRGGIQRLRSNRSGSVQSHGRGVYLGTETPNDSWGQHAYRVQVRGRREDFPQMWSPLSSRDGLLERFQQAGQGRRVEFTPDMHVDNAYQRLADAMPGWTEKARELAASRALARAGVPGIAGDFTRPQIVVFDDGALSIVERAKGAPRHWRADTGALDDGIPPVSDYPVAPPPTTPTGTAPFGGPRAYPPQAWEEFGSLQGGTPEARLRAQEQGWDARGYHATTADIQGGMRPSLSGELGPGVYVARQPKTTETYIGGSIWNDFDATPPSRPQQFFEGANIMPIVTRGKIATREQLDAAQEAARKRMRRRYRDDQDVQQAAADDLRAQGYTGASDPSRDFTVMFADPDGQVRNIRSVNAAFDPSKRDSSDLLAITNDPGGIGPGSVPPLAPPSTSDSVAMRMARAERMGFDTRPFYHGSPDARQVRERGGFERRTQNAGYLTDPERYAAIQSEMAAERAANGTSERYFELLNEATALNQHVEAPRPIYLSDNEGIARSYARDDRAFDYQGAEPAVMPLHTRGNLMVVDGGGERFANMSIDRIRASLPESRRAAFDAMVARYKADFTGNPGRITTNDLEAIAHGMGFDGFEVRNVRDTYQGQGAPSTVRAIFDPSNLRSPGAAFDPSKSGSSDLLAASAAAVPIPLAAALSHRQTPEGRPNRRSSDSQRTRGAFDRTGR